MHLCRGQHQQHQFELFQCLTAASAVSASTEFETAFSTECRSDVCVRRTSGRCFQSQSESISSCGAAGCFVAWSVSGKEGSLT